ncbi:MAG: hypothetical protein A2X91_03840 [Deltaproteobacteria bacterium GWB2_65_81]|nr:MAG: hypothetical protein A2X90_11240 [Deltaproteobacteria bacterium GWA2_65_63]OGP27937.1 MAG: hypothetical protein A2X91_03840 [Deltaproteobacteria bacterium GWB2_65_81]OGP40417.1 MAG: hypothetical protein A2X98_01530 [Deltaproteobacteria bacterium GWC2_66_88]HAM33256.1 hypothetical protein [Deltaproteobacteria bacterium]
MTRAFRLAVAAFALCGLAATVASATPSTQIWIPSTDIQPYKSFHLGFDTYIRANSNADGSRTAPVVVIGPTVGILPYPKIQAEVGFDVISAGGDLDKYPLYFHGKLGTPEDTLFKASPAIAVGGYNFGTKSGDVRNGELATTQNLVYGLVAKNLPVIGRLSAGYFTGNKKVLLDENGNSDEKGVLLSWDRTLTEISDKLWVAVDYQGTNSALGALSFGASWAFAKNVSVILGYDIYNEKRTGGENTVTMQLDINFP